MAAFLDNCRFNPTLGGTTDWTYSSAVAGYQSPAGAAVVNGTKYKYFAIDTSNNWELGEGAYNTSTGVLARTTILYSTNSNAKVNFPAAPQVAIVALKEDMISVEEANSFTAAQQKQARANIGAPDTNIIINSDFRINQRAYVSAATLAAGVYGHDRWKAGASGGDYSFTQIKSSTQITIAASKTLIQIVEDANVVGGSYVLSWTGTCQARVGLNTATPSGSFAASPILITGQTAATTMSVEFGNGASTGTLGTVKLETGAAATPFVMRPYPQELADCMRYFEVISAASNGSMGVGIAQIAAATRAVLAITWKVVKRAAPTVTLSAASDWSFYNAGITSFVVWSTFSASAVEWGGVLDVTTTTAGLSAAAGATVATPNAATLAARIFISAEL